jgi:hypothetical protein
MNSENTHPATVDQQPSGKKASLAKAKKTTTKVGEEKGIRLMRLINSQAAIRGMDSRKLCQEFGMSYTYFITLAAKPSRLEGLNQEYMRKIAYFLGITTVMAYEYAGFFEDSDFNIELTLDKTLARVRENIEKDSSFGIYSMSEEQWKKATTKEKLLISSMYTEIQRLTLELEKHKIGKMVEMLPENPAG